MKEVVFANENYSPGSPTDGGGDPKDIHQTSPVTVAAATNACEIGKGDHLVPLKNVDYPVKTAAKMAAPKSFPVDEKTRKLNDALPLLRNALDSETNALLDDDDCRRFLRARRLKIPDVVLMIQRWKTWRTTPFTPKHSSTTASAATLSKAAAVSSSPSITRDAGMQSASAQNAGSASVFTSVMEEATSSTTGIQNAAESREADLAMEREEELPTPALFMDGLIHPDKHEDIYRDLMPHANLGFDKLGHPVYWERTGLISSRFHKVKKLLTEDDLFIRHVRQNEMAILRMQSSAQKRNHTFSPTTSPFDDCSETGNASDPQKAGEGTRQQEVQTELEQAPRVLVEKQVLVFDLKKISFSVDLMAMNVFRRTLKVDEACYPERLRVLFMINAPVFFSATWAVVRPWLDPVTAEKIQILGSNYQTKLKEYIDEDQIPVEYGGTRENFAWEWPHNFEL